MLFILKYVLLSILRKLRNENVCIIRPAVCNTFHRLLFYEKKKTIKIIKDVYTLQQKMTIQQSNQKRKFSLMNFYRPFAER